MFPAASRSPVIPEPTTAATSSPVPIPSRKVAAFSDPTRLRILHLLREGGCVGDLVAILDLPQPTISRHLAYLRRSQLVETRKSGLWTCYSLAPAKSEFHRKLLDCLIACFADVPELKKDATRAKLKKSGRCCEP